MPRNGEVVNGYKFYQMGSKGVRMDRRGATMKSGFDPKASSSKAPLPSNKPAGLSIKTVNPNIIRQQEQLRKDELAAQRNLKFNQEQTRLDATRNTQAERDLAAKNVKAAQYRADRERQRREASAAYLRELMDDAPDLSAEALRRNAEILTPKADEATQIGIDYITSLLSNESSMLRRMVDGDYDFAYFNQGVVEPLRNAFEESQEDVLAAFTGGDPYGRQGGVQTGAAKAALAKGSKAFNEQIAGLRHQEYNAMMARSLEATSALDDLLGAIDHRPYESIGLAAAMDNAGMQSQQYLGRLNAAGNQYNTDSNVFAQTLAQLRSAEEQGLNTQTAGADRNLTMRMNQTEQWNDMAFNIFDTDMEMNNIATTDQFNRWSTLLEHDFAVSEARRDQYNTNLNRRTPFGGGGGYSRPTPTPRNTSPFSIHTMNAL